MMERDEGRGEKRKENKGWRIERSIMEEDKREGEERRERRGVERRRVELQDHLFRVSSSYTAGRAPPHVARCYQYATSNMLRR